MKTGAPFRERNGGKHSAENHGRMAWIEPRSNGLVGWRVRDVEDALFLAASDYPHMFRGGQRSTRAPISVVLIEGSMSVASTPRGKIKTS